MRLPKKPHPCPPGALAANTAALAALVWLPLYMPCGYVGLVQHKFALLLVIVLCASAGALVSWGYSALHGRRRKPEHPSLSWLPLPLLCVDYAVAWLFAENRHTALWGRAGRYNGLVLLLACTALYFTVRLFAGGLPAGWFCRGLAYTGCGITLLCWLNVFLCDPLDAYYTFLPDKGGLFLGTVGNTNFYGAFLCLCLPICVWELLHADTRRRTVGWLAASVLTATGLTAAGCDAAWLGCGCAAALLCLQKDLQNRQLARLTAALAVFGTANAAAGLAGRLLPMREEWRTVSAVVTSPLPALGGVVLFAVLTLFLRRTRRTARRAVPAVFGAAAALGVLTVVLANRTNLLPAELCEALRFCDTWGSGRGYVWRRSWEIWRDDITLFQRLFGLGGEGCYEHLVPDAGTVQLMRELSGDVMDSPHNVYLQHLLCGGAVGLALWAVFLAQHIRRGLKSCPAAAAALLGYAVQAVFSIDMPAVLAPVFVLAALCTLPKPLARRGEWRTLAALAALALPAAWLADVLAQRL